MSTPRGPTRPAGAGAMQTPTTGGGAAFRTPTTAGGGGATSRRTPGTAGGGLPSATRTPHALAARRALDTRRTAMFTPGGRQSRRKSGRMLRDSPRDLLRNLSRRLAPTSQPVPSSSSSSRGSSVSPAVAMSFPRGRLSIASVGQRDNYNDDDDDDDSLPLDSPRMSLLIAEDDNDDLLQPHRSMILDDDENENDDGDADADADADFANFTSRSIELARRAATQEQLLQARRFSRASLGGRSSFGSMRMSDYMDGYLVGDEGGGGGMDQIDLDLADEAQSAFFAEGAFDNLGTAVGADAEEADATFERLDSGLDGDVDVDVDVDVDMARRSGLAGGGRESEFGVIEAPLDGNETTFMMGQQAASPERTLGTELIPDDGDGNGNGNDNGHGGFGNLEDYYDNENNGSMWQDYDDDADGDNDNDNDNNDAAAGTDAAAVTAGYAAVTNGLGIVAAAQAAAGTHQLPKKQRLKLSAHGIPYPSLPAGVIKRIAQTFAESSTSGAGRAKLSTETVAALSTASDYFFEQVGVDLQRYARHAGRKTIDESDMLLLMRRQRQVTAATTPFLLAQRFLPRELLQELRMIPDGTVKRRPRKGKGKEKAKAKA